MKQKRISVTLTSELENALLESGGRFYPELGSYARRVLLEGLETIRKRNAELTLLEKQAKNNQDSLEKLQKRIVLPKKLDEPEQKIHRPTPGELAGETLASDGANSPNGGSENG